MSPRQLYDSLVQATGLRREPERPLVRSAATRPRPDFLEAFAGQDEKPTERQTSILQALTLMNGRLMADATEPRARGATLPAVADAYFLDTPGKVEALYLARSDAPADGPRSSTRLVAYVERGGPDPATPRRRWPTCSGRSRTAPSSS